MAENDQSIGEHHVDHAEAYDVGLPVEHGVNHLDHGVNLPVDHDVDLPVDHDVDHHVDHGLDNVIDHGLDHGIDHEVDRELVHTDDHGLAVDHEEDYSIDHPVDHDVEHDIEDTDEQVLENFETQKQGHVEDTNAIGGEKKWPGWPGESVFRMLVPAQKVGSIIGRKGEFIKKIVEETRARIKILDGPPGTTERAVLPVNLKATISIIIWTPNVKNQRFRLMGSGLSITKC